jgi:hypothetical protein
MKAIPCPITPEELRRLYQEEKLTDEQIVARVGQGATLKRVRAWRRRFGVETIGRTERHVLPSIEGRLQSVLVGSMLGDGRISKSTHVSRFMESHSDAQKPYSEWKIEEWGSWVKVPIAPTQWREFPGWRFETVSHATMNPWHELFYPEPGPKRLQERVVELVDPLAFTIWYMDDGSANWWPLITFGMDPASRGIALAIFDKFGFSPRWELCSGSTKTGQFIFEGEDQAHKFIELVKPHMPEFMHYKLEFGFQGPQYQLRNKLTREVLTELASKGTPIRRMAEILGEAPTTIDRYLKKYGIEHARPVGRPRG